MLILPHCSKSIYVMFFKCYSCFEIICFSEIFIHDVEVWFLFIEHLRRCFIFLKEAFIEKCEKMHFLKNIHLGYKQMYLDDLFFILNLFYTAIFAVEIHVPLTS